MLQVLYVFLVTVAASLIVGCGFGFIFWWLFAKPEDDECINEAVQQEEWWRHAERPGEVNGSAVKSMEEKR